MEPSEDQSAASVVSSSDFLNPGGKSRYGRTRRPKISQDFCNIDDVIIDENPSPRLSSVKSAKSKLPPKSPIIGGELVFDIKDEFTKLDDLGMKVANNFKTNLQRGLDDTIKERKFFKTLPENKMEGPNLVDVTKVFKLISKPVVSEVYETKTPPKSAVKTYSNRRKHLHDSDSFILESFGLPDEPIIPVNSPLSVARDTKIDVDLSSEDDVNLSNPWCFDGFDPLPLYASEPVEEINFTRGSLIDLFSCDNLLKENNLNFEKPKISTPVVPSFKDSGGRVLESARQNWNPLNLDIRKPRKRLLKSPSEIKKTAQNNNIGKSICENEVVKVDGKVPKSQKDEIAILEGNRKDISKISPVKKKFKLGINQVTDEPQSDIVKNVIAIPEKDKKKQGFPQKRFQGLVGDVPQSDIVKNVIQIPEKGKKKQGSPKKRFQGLVTDEPQSDIVKDVIAIPEKDKKKRGSPKKRFQGLVADEPQSDIAKDVIEIPEKGKKEQGYPKKRFQGLVTDEPQSDIVKDVIEIPEKDKKKRGSSKKRFQGLVTYEPQSDIVKDVIEIPEKGKKKEGYPKKRFQGFVTDEPQSDIVKNVIEIPEKDKKKRGSPKKRFQDLVTYEPQSDIVKDVIEIPEKGKKKQGYPKKRFQGLVTDEPQSDIVKNVTEIPEKDKKKRGSPKKRFQDLVTYELQSDIVKDVIEIPEKGKKKQGSPKKRFQGLVTDEPQSDIVKDVIKIPEKDKKKQRSPKKKFQDDQPQKKEIKVPTESQRNVARDEIKIPEKNKKNVRKVSSPKKRVKTDDSAQKRETKVLKDFEANVIKDQIIIPEQNKRRAARISPTKKIVKTEIDRAQKRENVANNIKIPESDKINVPRKRFRVGNNDTDKRRKETIEKHVCKDESKISEKYKSLELKENKKNEGKSSPRKNVEAKNTPNQNKQDEEKTIGLTKNEALEPRKGKTKEFQISPLKSKNMANSHFPKRVLRSTIDNNNVEIKETISQSTSKEDCQPITSKNSLKTKITKSKTQVINPVNISNQICIQQVRVLLNPLSCMDKLLENKIPNPFRKNEKSKTKKSPKFKTNSVSKVTVGRKRKTLKKNERRAPKLDVDKKNIKTEIIEYQVGDLVWAKIGRHPYWPCMITEEPMSGDHKKAVINRVQPLFHVRFFGDKGRRSWVSAQFIMLFFGRDDLDNLAKMLQTENTVKTSFIKECCRVNPKKLEKWRSGVDEAESLKCKSVEERFDYFFEAFASKREKKRRLKELGIKEEIVEDSMKSLENESPGKNKKKRGRSSEGYYNASKKLKRAFPEVETEIKVEDEGDDLRVFPRCESPKKKILQKVIPDEKMASPSARHKIEEAIVEAVKSPKGTTKIRRTRSNDEVIVKIKSPQERKKIGRKSQASEVSLETIKTPDNRDLSESIEEPRKETIEDKQTPDGRKKFLKPEEFSEKNLEARKKLRNSQVKVDTPEPSEVGLEVPKKKRNSVESLQESEENIITKMRNKRHLLPGEYSNSDTDSKFSDNSSVPASLESQAALYRRNNIFRGIPRDKVCQICEKTGEVFKCKGPCNGVYHYDCAIDEIKEKSEEKIGHKETVTLGRSNNEKEEETNNVEIISVNSKKPLPNLSESPNYKGMSLAEKIDFRMKEIMKKFDYQTMYYESTDSSGEEFLMDESFDKLKNQSKLSLTVTNKPSKKEVPIIKHVTADNVSYICVTNQRPKEVTDLIVNTIRHLKCKWCLRDESSRCLVCNKDESKTGSKFRQKCSLHQCGKYYHQDCLKMWPQTQWSLIQSTKDKISDAIYDTFVCPRHVCHTCISDDPRAANSRCTSDKVVKCLRCPATYHSSNYCVPAGSHILSTSQIVCPRHYSKQNSRRQRQQQTINTNWCFICSKGGNLICCETCPTSVHVECLPGDLNEDDTFYCEDCQSGRLPLYDEIVWVKLGTFRWWPALILFPNEVPDNVKNIIHNRGEFVVKFFGTYDHYWVGRGRTFLFQEGDKGHSHSVRKRVDNAFAKAIEEAAAAHQLKKQFKLNKVAEKNSGLKPPPYIRIKVNKPVGNVRLFDGNTSNTTSCECDPNQPHPCGPDSDCLNRLLLTECNPEVCPAGERCNNQSFEKREYPPLIPHRTQVRGWGLKTLAPVRKGQFVIEYVGEMIDEQEYQRRIQKMHQQKEENYYFLTIEKDRTLDAGPKGNVARFMNHSCQPNCETQKWTVNGDTRVGLFAKCDIPADTELTFNYNLECIGKEKKMCKCGAPNCSGFIGVKVKTDPLPKKSTRPKKKKTPPPEVVDNENPCFICGKMGEVGICNNKICSKYYHLGCVVLTAWPEGGKWVCQWHNCNICSKRTIRCCVKCVNSYCPSHSEGNVRYDKLMGFVCIDHDPTKEKTSVHTEVPKPDDSAITKEGAVTPTTSEDVITDPEKPGDEEDTTLDLTNPDGFMASTPLKKTRETSSQDESTVSSASIYEVKSQSTKRKKTRTKKSLKVEKKVEVKNNTANLFNTSIQNEIKLSKFTPIRYMRTSKNSTKFLNKTDPEKDLPIRKRTRLRCGNTL